MENGTDEQADDDEKQHIGDAFAAENLAEKVSRENEQANDGDGQADFARRATIVDLLGNRVDQTWVEYGTGNLHDGVVDS